MRTHARACLQEVDDPEVQHGVLWLLGPMQRHALRWHVVPQSNRRTLCPCSQAARAMKLMGSQKCGGSNGDQRWWAREEVGRRCAGRRMAMRAYRAYRAYPSGGACGRRLGGGLQGDVFVSVHLSAGVGPPAPPTQRRLDPPTYPPPPHWVAPPPAAPAAKQAPWWGDGSPAAQPAAASGSWTA
jgi:hypothetical protein